MMKTNVHLTFEGGKCTEAFAFYEKVFNTKSEFKMTYGEAPLGAPVPEGAKDLVMHMSMPLGSMLLMGCDIPPSMPSAPMRGFEISVDMPEESEVKRIFSELSEGGNVVMPATPTFWSPIFGMCTDKFGVGWMVSVPGPEMRKP
jgi:PhnB protein